MTGAVHEVPASYAAVHRYNGAVLQHDAREQLAPMAIQPRDFAIVLDVWRYKFLTAPMVHELHWDGGSMWPAQRRLQKMFHAGLLERFRPISLRGSYPWTYHLGERGHVILRDSQVVDTGWRYRPHVVHEFGHVLHDLQLNAWVLAYRRQSGVRFLSWEGERTIEPPPSSKDDHLEPRWLPGGGWTVHGLHDWRWRPVRPDAVIELGRGEWKVPHMLLVEFDRTRRVDKNFDKFRRYDTFLVWWREFMEAADLLPAPYVVFVCQDEDQLDQFLHAADYELTGHHDCLDYNRDRFVGRNRILFAVEKDMHAGRLDAWRVPAVPRGHLNREKHSRIRGVGLTVGD
ncbi:MAG TPA: replication-relaxation family protein [Solirubrobacteraceae bacterium]|nr:replication-relaxation family protein [Solirubrobacteraceae bacterium]